MNVAATPRTEEHRVRGGKREIHREARRRGEDKKEIPSLPPRLLASL
jgi:hypothetical protein